MKRKPVKKAIKLPSAPNFSLRVDLNCTFHKFVNICHIIFCNMLYFPFNFPPRNTFFAILCGAKHANRADIVWVTEN